MSNSDDRIRTPTALSDLIAIGKAKGFLTYDDVNDLMPESVISTSEIDAWLSVLGAEGIEIVDRPPGEEDEDAT
jgi:RNA polymerase primary sigma factor